jgi:hypothetical protein
MWRCGVAALIALSATCCAAARYQGVLHLPGAQPNPEPPTYPASFEACPALHLCTVLRASLLCWREPFAYTKCAATA